MAAVDATDTPSRQRQYAWMVANYPADQITDDWVDAEGFSFHRGEFS